MYFFPQTLPQFFSPCLEKWLFNLVVKETKPNETERARGVVNG
jgi:hypothetical protein